MHGHFKVTPATVARGQPITELPSGLDPRHLWSVFLRRWQIVLGAVVVVAALMALWVMQTTPIYTASTQVLIDPRKERVLKEEAVISELGLDASTIATEVSLVQSFAIARRVVEKLKLAQHPQFGGAKPGFSFAQWLGTLLLGADSEVNEESNPVAKQPEPPEGGSDLTPAVLASVSAVQGGISVRRVAGTLFI